jgi:L,D-transpeptidase YcbB
MTTNKQPIPVLFILLLFICCNCSALDTTAIKAIVQKLEQDKKFAAGLQMQQPALTAKFYSIKHFRPVWFVPGSPQRINDLLAMINKAGDYLLMPSGYRSAYIAGLKTRPPATAADSLYAEIKCSDAALSLLHDIAYGEGPPTLRYNGLAYHPDCIELPSLLAGALQNNNLQTAMNIIEPSGEKYTLLKNEFQKLLAVTNQQNFREITVGDKTVAVTNTALVSKLQQLHYLPADSVTKKDLLAAINTLQKQHNLLVQNKINQYTINVLNEPIADKLKELQWNMRWYRWLNCIVLNHHCIILNLPANRLTYFEHGHEKFSCRVVVGKITTPTPTLTSTVKQVIYYPYWNVPYSIAVKEMLPVIRRNPGYLAKNHYEVLQGGRVVDPSGINWWKYSTGNFPFDFRQQPGCYNALGRLKFDFENPFSVYLHDTNNKTVFQAGKRFFSHGCMRVEKPYELALAIGVKAEKINMDSCLTGMKPQIIPLEKSVPVLVIYATVDVQNGQLVWYEDAYRKREKQ